MRSLLLKYFFPALMMLCIDGYGQPTFTRSKEDILKSLATATSNEDISYELSAMGFYYWKKNYQPDSSLYFFNRMLDFCMANNFKTGIAKAHRCIGRHYTRHSQFELARSHLFKSYTLANSLGFEQESNYIEYALGDYFNRTSQLDSAYYFYQKSLSNTKEDELYLKADLYLVLGIVLAKSGSFLEAEKNYLESISIRENINDDLFLYVGIVELSDFYTRDLIDPNKYSKYYLKLEALRKSMGIAMTSYHANAFIVDEMDYEERISFLNKSLNFLKDKKYYDGIIHVYLKIFQNLYKEKHYAKVDSKVNEAIHYIKDANILDLDFESEIYKYQYKIDSINGNYKDALTVLNYRNELRDSIQRKRNSEEVKELNIKYESTLKEKQIAESKLEIDKKTNQRNILFILSFLLFSLIGLNWKRAQQKSKIAKQEKLLQQQKINEFEKEKRILSLAAMLEGQESERIRIAKDLHDGLGGLLSTVKAHFAKVQSEIKKIEKIQIYNKATGMIDEACDEVRRVSHNLMPGILRLSGLVAAVHQIVNNLEDTHDFKVDYEVSSMEVALSESQEIFIYRVIQELTNNIIKHSGAKSILIQMIGSSTSIQLVVEDDGVGFDLNAPIEKYGLGLKSVASRVNFLNGDIDIRTNINEGTSITINIPIAEYPIKTNTHD